MIEMFLKFLIKFEIKSLNFQIVPINMHFGFVRLGDGLIGMVDFIDFIKHTIYQHIVLTLTAN